MDLKEIQDLLKLVNKLELTEFKMRNGDFELSIRTKNYEKGKSKVHSAQPIMSVPTSPVTVAHTAVAPVAENGDKPAVSALPPQKAETPGQEESEADGLIEVKSPIVGTFYRSPSPDKPPYIKVGDTIEVGSIVCIVEAMKLFNEIESEVAGKIVKVVVEDASPVEYDQVLFLVDPNG